MDVKNFVGLLVFGVIGVIVLSAFVPIISETTSATKTFENDGYYRMTNTDEETVITWTPSVEQFVIQVNGVDVSLENLKNYGAYRNYSIAFADDVIVRYYYETANSQNIQIWTSDYHVGMGSNSIYTMTVTINSSGLTFTTSEPDYVPTSVAHSGDYFIIDANGEFVMKFSDKTAYILKDTTIFYAGGISGVATSIFSSIYIEGTVLDYEVTPLRNYVTISNKDSTFTEVSGYIDLVELDKLTFDTTYSPPGGTETERNQTYSYFLVPYEVTAEKSVHPDDALSSVIDLLPLIAGIGLMIILVAEFLYTRYL